MTYRRLEEMVPARPITILGITRTDLYFGELRVTSTTCTHLQICATRPKSFKDVPARRSRHRPVITALVTQQVVACQADVLVLLKICACALSKSCSFLEHANQNGISI